jgi:hypothetical protein
MAMFSSKKELAKSISNNTFRLGAISSQINLNNETV